MKFDTMRPFHKGKSDEGHDQFEIPMKPDEDGLIGRECPNEDCDTKYFKISMTIPDGMESLAENFSQYELTCPYCGTPNNMQHLHTTAQIEWIKSMLFRDMAKAFGDMLERSVGRNRSSRGGMFSISMSVKRGSLPSVRHYVEEKLKQEVTCDKCNFRYAIYGVSFHCPLCGKGNISLHLERSAETIRVLAIEASRIAKDYGSEAGERMLGNALEDVVSLFEGFLKYLYRYAIRKAHSKEDAEKLIKKIKVNFQRLTGAEEFFQRDLNVDLFAALTQKERETLELTFAKRHILTHNLGLIDDKYKNQISSWNRVSSELVVEESDVLTALDLTKRTLSHAISQLIPT